MPAQNVVVIKYFPRHMPVDDNLLEYKHKD
jgi:hypothetical protein